MACKHIEQARETRMWLGQVIVPAAIIVGTYLSNLQNRYEIKDMCQSIKNSVMSKFQKD